MEVLYSAYRTLIRGKLYKIKGKARLNFIQAVLGLQRELAAMLEVADSQHGADWTRGPDAPLLPWRHEGTEGVLTPLQMIWKCSTISSAWPWRVTVLTCGYA